MRYIFATFPKAVMNKCVKKGRPIQALQLLPSMLCCVSPSSYAPSSPTLRMKYRTLFSGASKSLGSIRCSPRWRNRKLAKAWRSHRACEAVHPLFWRLLQDRKINTNLVCEIRYMRWTNLRTNQSTIRPFIEPISRPSKQTFNQLTNQKINHPNNQPTKQSINQQTS